MGYLIIEQYITKYNETLMKLFYLGVNGSKMGYFLRIIHF